jgi:ABC-2 type transport system permease protein
VSWRKVRTIAAFELRGVVRNWAFWMLTVVYPLILSGSLLGFHSAADRLPPPPPQADLPSLRATIAIGFAWMFGFPMLLLSGAFLAQATTEERESRVGEVLLAAVRADELVLGKLLGIGTAVLLQTALWIAPMAIALHASAQTAAALPTAAEEIQALAILILGSAFTATLFLTAACIGTARTAQQSVVGLLTIFANVPLFASLHALMTAPGGSVARALSWFPFTSSIVTAYRILAAPESIAPLERLGIAVLLAMLTLALVRLAARLLRVTLVSAGAPLGLRAALRQSRLG